MAPFSFGEWIEMPQQTATQNIATQTTPEAHTRARDAATQTGEPDEVPWPPQPSEPVENQWDTWHDWAPHSLPTAAPQGHQPTTPPGAPTHHMAGRDGSSDPTNESGGSPWPAPPSITPDLTEQWSHWAARPSPPPTWPDSPQEPWTEWSEWSTWAAWDHWGHP